MQKLKNMAIKKITLTDDHLKLIKNINFESFDLGEYFNTEYISDAIAEIESSDEMMKKYGSLRDKLVKTKDKLEYVSDRKQCRAWGIDQWSVFGGTWAMEDIALILGCWHKFISGTEENATGREYPEFLEDYFWKLYDDIVSNMEYIISLVLFYTDKGGLTAGVYKCKTSDRIWTKTDETFENKNWKDVWNENIERLKKEVSDLYQSALSEKDVIDQIENEIGTTISIDEN